MNEQTAKPKGRSRTWALLAGGAIFALILLAQCAGGGSVAIDMSTATCKSLIPHIIEMSQDRDPKILEITGPTTGPTTHYGTTQIACYGQAEWTRGDGSITYGAYVSDGGNVMLEYQQN